MLMRQRREGMPHPTIRHQTLLECRLAFLPQRFPSATRAGNPWQNLGG
jgi:hypothetical protein